MPSRDGWGGRQAARARARVAALLPLPCRYCGQPVYPEQPWDLEHIQPRATHPWLMWDPANHGAAHRRCNRRAGQRMTSALRRRRPRPTLGPSRAW